MALIAGDLLPTIKKLAASYIKEIGGTDTAQTVTLCSYLTHALQELAYIAYQTAISDPLTITADGYVTFVRDSVDINMYAPLRIIGEDGCEVTKRTSYVDFHGWWRESGNTPIHVKALPPGDYALHYLAYPRKVTLESDPIDFPESASLGLCYHASALVIESLPDAKDMAAHYYGLASRSLKIAVQANIDARGQVSGGNVPYLQIVDKAFKG